MTRIHVTSPYAEGPRQAAAGPPPRVPVLAHYVVLGSAAGTAALLVAIGIIATVETDALREWWWTTSPDHEALTLMGLFSDLTAVTNLAFIATGVWLLQIRSVAEWASPGTHHRRSPVWALLGWVVPVVNLWFPCQVVDDVSRGVGSSVRTFWPWWVAWLALNFSTIAAALKGPIETEADLLFHIRTQQAGAVIALIALVLWWRIVRSATTAATAAATEVRVTS